MESKEKLFHKLYNADMADTRLHLATDLTASASTPTMNLALPQSITCRR
jgi:hypothetical protein